MAKENPTPALNPAADPPERAEGFATADVEAIFREHNDALVRFVTARIGSQHEAREIAQEAYVKLLSLHHRETVSYLRAFLYKVAANLATDRLRSRSRRSFVAHAGILDRAIFEPPPEAKLEDEQTLAHLRAAIEELPQPCRDAFLLYRMEELTCREVAVRLGLQERMVWRYVSRALEYVRTRLNGDLS